MRCPLNARAFPRRCAAGRGSLAHQNSDLVTFSAALANQSHVVMATGLNNGTVTASLNCEGRWTLEAPSCFALGFSPLFKKIFRQLELERKKHWIEKKNWFNYWEDARFGLEDALSSGNPWRIHNLFHHNLLLCLMAYFYDYFHRFVKMGSGWLKLKPARW